ncbi:MAG: outer membrane beta-barrel protein [Saprospiraceae bacterium]|nr:outer membrane beta-barrel protein [Saprospiraceae bacterium]
MNKITVFIIAGLFFAPKMAAAQDGADIAGRYWQIGIGLGELPIGGSFKPSITIGYHFSEKFYCGLIYQFRDRISRGQQSFNVRSSGLDGLMSSHEKVNRRFLLQARYTPFKNGPYLSTGLVFNGRDAETMSFDDRARTIAGEDYAGTIGIEQSRPAGWGLALGIGYQYNFKNGLLLSTEWTPAWFRGYPQPDYKFSGSAGLSDKARSHLEDEMDRGFRSSVTNLYKVFHLGLGYRFQ